MGSDVSGGGGGGDKERFQRVSGCGVGAPEQSIMRQHLPLASALSMCYYSGRKYEKLARKIANKNSRKQTSSSYLDGVD